jgi:release factor glutamine methyltransferase
MTSHPTQQPAAFGPLASDTTLRDATAAIAAAISPLYGQREAKAIATLAVEHTMGYSTVQRVMHWDERLSRFILDKLADITNRLLTHEPVQYILGQARFYGMKLNVNPSVLIPRPETEELVDMIVSENTGTDLKVLDVGTGSGAIAIALARNLRFADVDAVDISPAAIATANGNAKALKARVKFSVADALNLPAPPCPIYDIIVSNPPYIMDHERADMERNVTGFEPPTALFVPDDDPLLFYNAIMAYASEALKPGGKIYFEINPLQAEALTQAATDTLQGSTAAVIADIHGRQRFVTITLATTR